VAGTKDEGRTTNSAGGPSRARSVLRPSPFVAWGVYLPALAILALYGWAFLDHAWSVVAFPYQLDYGEMPELNRAWLLAQRRPIYVDWSHPPYQMANYPPLYSAVAAAGVALRGPQFLTGRLISFASTLVAGACVAGIARALGAGWRAALVGGLLYFTGHPVWNWGAFQRVDSFAVALELVGVAVFAAGWVGRRRRPGEAAARGWSRGTPPERGAVGGTGCPHVAEGGGRWAVWATVPVFLAAVYTRQTVVAGAFACYLYLLCTRPRLGAAVVATYAAAGLAIVGALQLGTGGQF
jgi:hypothetical protein